MKSSVALIVNPVSGSFSKKGFAEAESLFKRVYRNVYIYYTQKSGDGETIVTKLLNDPPEMIVVVGGDGTFNEVVNGNIDSNIPISLIPTGTANVFAKEFSIPEDFHKATNYILSGIPYYLNLGRLNKRYFVLMAGIGFDGDTVYRLNKNIKSIAGKGAYILSGLGAVSGYKPNKLNITVDSVKYEGYGLVVCNASRYAGAFKICPDADVRTLDLSVFIMHSKGRAALLRYITGVLIGRHLGFKDITYRKGKEIFVDGDARIQIDGDYYGRAPAIITIEEKALKFVLKHH